MHADEGAAAAADSETTRLTAFESRCLSTPVTIVEEKVKGIGFQLWPAASFLCRFLEDQLVPAVATHGGDDGSNHGSDGPPRPPQGLLELPKPLSEIKCLELGAGVGLVGLFMAGIRQQHPSPSHLNIICQPPSHAHLHPYRA